MFGLAGLDARLRLGPSYLYIRMIFSTSQASIIFHDTFPFEYRRSATLLPLALAITASTLGTMRVPSAAIFRTTIAGAPASTSFHGYVLGWLG